jgi:hypothetical protein
LSVKNGRNRLLSLFSRCLHLFCAYLKLVVALPYQFLFRQLRQPNLALGREAITKQALLAMAAAGIDVKTFMAH